MVVKAKPAFEAQVLDQIQRDNCPSNARALTVGSTLLVTYLELERYSLKIIRIVSGTESKKRRFRSSSSLFAISSVTVKVYLLINNSFTSINGWLEA